MTSKNRDNMYLKLVELQVALDKELDQHYIERILQNDLGVNYRAPLHLMGKYKVGGMTALHLAQYERRIDISKLLLAYGVDFTLKNSMGSTALHAAVERAYEYENYTVAPLLESTHEFANLILSAHIQSKNFNNPCNNNGISHFHAACTVNNVEAVRFFLDNGVSVDQPINVDSPILPGYTALHIAVKYYSLEVFAALLQYNANMHAKNSTGLTPVHMCINQKIEWCNYTSPYSSTDVEKRIEKRLEISDQILHLTLQKYSSIDDVGVTYLHIACIVANTSDANHILQQCANIDHSVNSNSPIFAGYTAFHFAAQCNIDAVKLLVAKGADVHLKDSKGRSPLDLFLHKFSIRQIHSILSCHPVWKDILLVDNKTKLVDLIDALGNCAAFDLIERNFGSNIKLPLIPNNSPLWPGYTLLHLVMALTDEPYGFIHKCSKRGADATTQDSFGSTPLHVAAEKHAYISWKIFLELWKSCPEIANPVNQNNLSHLHLLSADGLYGPLQYLSKTKDSNLMKELLLKDKEMEVQSHIPYKGRTIRGIVSGSTPLHLAVHSVEKTKLLMEFGADIYAVDAQGFTPIHRLIKTERDGGKEAGAILFATPDLKDYVVSSIGLSYLHVASHLDDVESVKKFLDLGTDINLRISPRLPAEYSFLEEYAGCTPLQIAVSNNSKGVVKFLLRHGADMFTKKNHDDPPLIYQILNRKKDDHLTTFVDTVKNNYALRKRFNEETGLTMFHVACHKLDVDSMKQYLQNQGATINNRAHADSPIWPGLTALHILRDRMRLLGWDDNDRYISAEDQLKNDNIVDKVLGFLLNNGADVTIADNNGNTPIHLFFKKMESSFTDYPFITACYKTTDFNFQKIESTCKKDYGRVSRLLKVHKDFSINPTDLEGTSHFHIACRMNDFAIVQKFCKYGGVDINEPNRHGDTPLHFSVRSFVVKYSGLAAQLKTIDCLLKHGAELNIQNNIGNTPLHETIFHRQTADVKDFEKLFKAGADPNIENVFHSTPFELLCTSRNSSVKHFKLFVKFGCQFNTFNSMSNEGFVGLIFNNQNPKWESILKFVLSLPEAKATDNMGRSFIHNVSSTKWIAVDKYKKINQQLSNLGCDIDSQDKGGETALHKAVKFSNGTVVFALIEAGADVNVADKNGKTALPYTFDSRSQFWISSLIEDDDNKYGIKSILLRHLAILDYCGLPICQMNEDIIKDQRDEYSRRFLQEMSKARYVKIGDSLTLQRFLSGETICAYPYTSLANRSAIRAFVESIDNSEYQELKPFVRLVFRQGEKRVGLIGDATGSLQMLSGSPVPDVCSRIIFGCLRNADLENLITAAFEDV